MFFFVGTLGEPRKIILGWLSLCCWGSPVPGSFSISSSCCLISYISSLCWATSSLYSVISEPALHTPMYIMLSNLSILDVFLATYATPKMIHDFPSWTQDHLLRGLHGPDILTPCPLLVVRWFSVAMAYDRDMAICKPLHYATIMNVCKCTGLVVGSWVIGVMHSLSQLAFTVNLPFCGPNVVNSYYCDLTLVIKLACTDTYVPEVLMLFWIVVSWGWPHSCPCWSPTQSSWSL